MQSDSPRDRVASESDDSDAGDQVTASAYAVRLLRTADDESPLSVTYLRRLLDYFWASREETRVADLEDELEHRHTDELAELRASLLPTTEGPDEPARPVVEAPLREPAGTLPGGRVAMIPPAGRTRMCTRIRKRSW